MLTQKDYENMRNNTLTEMAKYGIVFDKLTCDNCPQRLQCEFAADGYNTDGDCLAEK